VLGDFHPLGTLPARRRLLRLPMADQNTTVAALPAGYATLAGVVYAVAASSSKIWAQIAWARMSQISFGNAAGSNHELNGGITAGVPEKSGEFNIMSALSKTITRSRDLEIGASREQQPRRVYQEVKQTDLTVFLNWN
jgi:hypothetical protein